MVGLHHYETAELVGMPPIYSSTPNQRCSLFTCCVVMLLQVPTAVEALIKGPWDPDGAIWRKQLDMALEVINKTHGRVKGRKCARLTALVLVPVIFTM